VSVIVSPATLAQGLGNAGIKILDARFSLADATLGQSHYQQAHIPGAQYVDLNTDLSAAKTDARLGRHPLPSAAQWQAVLERLGITPEDWVVVYDQTDGAMAAARAWFLLRLAGHAQVAVLDGGLDAWQAAGLPLTNSLQVHGKSEYPVCFDQRLLISADELRAALQSGDDTRLLDARAAERFSGALEPIDAKAGHIPGALNRPYTHNLQAGRFKTPAQLHAEFAPLMAGARHTVLSCGSGVTACHNALALSHAGISEYRLFAPSWSGWIADPHNPLAVGA
jgi:thiosulfate/3-mercaptopyruvate sulfurtransferase